MGPSPPFNFVVVFLKEKKKKKQQQIWDFFGGNANNCGMVTPASKATLLTFKRKRPSSSSDAPRVAPPRHTPQPGARASRPGPATPVPRPRVPPSQSAEPSRRLGSSGPRSHPSQPGEASRLRSGGSPLSGDWSARVEPQPVSPRDISAPFKWKAIAVAVVVVVGYVYRKELLGLAPAVMFSIAINIGRNRSHGKYLAI